MSRGTRGVPPGAPRAAQKRSQEAKTKLPEASEHQIQVAFFAWARPYLRTKGIDPRLCYAVPNRQILMAGAKNKHAVMAYLRAEGFTDGIPDIHLDVPEFSRVHDGKVLFLGLRIELKRKGAKANTDQLEIVDLLRRRGYCCVIAVGFDEAQLALQEYVERV